MVILSRRNPEFSNLSDNEVIQKYIDGELLHRDLYLSLDSVDDAGGYLAIEKKLDNNSLNQFKLEDELCARDLDLPKVSR